VNARADILLRALVAVTGLASLLVIGGCGGPKRPSFLLFVMDTTRADAVSAYGRATFDTTPNFDALAREGLLYERAYAPAPWTLPSHASLFTGLLPASHGVGWRNTRMPESATTLAERLAEAGYATFGYSENVWVGKAFALAQGFEDYTQASQLPGRSGPSAEEQLARFLEGRDPKKPFFAFVNVIDAHWPYGQSDPPRFLPEGRSASDARRVSQLPGDWQCKESADRDAAAMLRALYEGDVALADAKLGRVLDALHAAGVFDETVVIVTADHGELLGDHGLFGHQYSLNEELLRVPLVVRGLAGATAARIEDTVSLVDVMPTLLAWAGLPTDEPLDGRPLPIASGADAGGRTVFAEYTDPAESAPGDESRLGRGMREQARLGRAGCSEDRWPRLYGDLRSAIAPPFKLVQYAARPPELFRVDGREGERLATGADAETRMRAFEQTIGERFASLPARRPDGAAREDELSPDVVEALESLGYIADEAPAIEGPDAGRD